MISIYRNNKSKDNSRYFMKTYVLKKDERGYFVNDTRLIEDAGTLKTGPVKCR